MLQATGEIEVDWITVAHVTRHCEEVCIPKVWKSSLSSYLHYSMDEEPAPSLLGRCKQKQRGLRGLLCRWPSITEWEMHITAQGPHLRNDLYCVEWDVKLYYTIPYHNVQK